MSCAIAWLLGLTSIATALDIWSFHRFAFLPHWLPTLLALVGLAVSAASFSSLKKKKKAKKLRRHALAAFVGCLFAALSVTGYWLVQMLSAAASSL